MKKFTLITGSGNGLGAEIAKIYASRGHNLLLVDINKEGLDSIKNELASQYKEIEIETLALDLTDRNNLQKVYDFTVENDLFINYLVNGAGFGDRCDFKDMSIQKQLKMNDLNIDALLYFTRVFLDNMLKNNEGNIMNISSIAAFMPGPFMCTYHATKAYVLNIGEAISHELKGTNVNLLTLCPGPFLSNFVKVAGNDYTFKKIKPLTAAQVAAIGVKALDKKKTLKIIGFKNRLTIFSIRLAPRKATTAVSAKMMKK